MQNLIVGIVLIVLFGVLCYVVAKLPQRRVFWRIVVSLLILAAFVGGLLFLVASVIAIPGICPTAVECPVCPAVNAPVTPLVVTATCDPSTVPFVDMGELDKSATTTINGPAIYEWWTGGSNEGVQRVDVGQTVTIHGVAGHWWTLPNQQGLDCAWKLHVENYAAKPQHVGKTYEQLVLPPPAEFLK